MDVLCHPVGVRGWGTRYRGLRFAHPWLPSMTRSGSIEWRRAGRSFLHNLLLLNNLSVFICVHLWFFNTIRGSLNAPSEVSLDFGMDVLL